MPGSEAVVLPRQGDLLIAAEPSRRYAVSVVPGPPQVLYQTFSEALAVARAFARSRPGASLWFRQDGTRFTALSLDQLSAPPPPAGVRRGA
jgi:hypothetical protein